MSARVLAAAAAAAVLVAGCGDSASTDAVEGSTSTPACSDVWIAGQTLPADYEGCMDGESLALAVSAGPCDVQTFEDRFYATPGRPIVKVSGDIAADPGYKRAFYSC